MSYFQTEIPRPRNAWAEWLRTFKAGEKREIDIKDMYTIRTSITRIHKANPDVLFKTKEYKKEGVGIVWRVL